MPAELTPNQLKWVEALESGDYEQGRGFLHRVDADEWCCLGVACDLAHKDGVAITREKAVGQLPTLEVFDGDTLVMPLAVADWLGVSHWVVGCVDVMIDGVKATVLNDREQLTFKEIAALIREHGLDPAGRQWRVN